MLERPRQVWELQNRTEGDRRRLFAAVATAIGGTRVLYPGAFVDLAASFVWPSVTYNDSDRRAARFFDDTDGIGELLVAEGVDPSSRTIDFVAGDYAGDLGLDDGSFDVLVSLFAGFVSEHCTRYLRVGGTLLVNSSHGDAAMASIDDRYRFVGAVMSEAGAYRVVTDDLDRFLVPKRAVAITVESLRESGRGVAYTESAFAYLFRRVA